jgi:hypothetical protein
MIQFASGAIACAIVYTFFPALAVKPSAWLRSAWAWFQARRNGPDDTDGAGA